MAYEKQEWVDHSVDDDGTVIQQGTSMDAEHFNHMEDGIYNASLGVGYMYYDDDKYLCVHVPDDDDSE